MNRNCQCDKSKRFEGDNFRFVLLTTVSKSFTVPLISKAKLCSGSDGEKWSNGPCQKQKQMFTCSLWKNIQRYWNNENEEDSLSTTSFICFFSLRDEFTSFYVDTMKYSTTTSSSTVGKGTHPKMSKWKARHYFMRSISIALLFLWKDGKKWKRKKTKRRRRRCRWRRLLKFCHNW